ncbi:MAG: glycosyltransferase [Candidatus Krumholzibacteria bacterium]|jgi:glycosyltransferase involved in cell wall biosynthesis|nr:glycosyltransferase [Candidatus Krumholzibacteria bacterium]
MPEPFDILCFGEDWYKTGEYSTKQIVRRMAEGRKLLWVNPLPMPIHMASGAESGAGKVILRKALHKIKTHLRWLSRSREGFWIHSPLYLPLSQNPRVYRFNIFLLRLQVALLCRLLGLVNPLVWASSTYHVLDVLDRIPHSRFCYRFSDKSSAFQKLPENGRAEIRTWYEDCDRRVLERADRVFCASRSIYEDLIERFGEKENLRYLPHGVDFDHFSGERPLPDSLRNLSHPLIGYYGALTSAQDFELLRHILESHPEWTLLMFGNVVGDFSSLEKYPNFLLPGPIPYADLPDHAQVFDVAIMTWKLNEWIENSFPVKTQEYLALGLPVVSVRIREIEREFSEVIAIADSKEDFVELIEKELKEDSPKKRQTRIDRVRNRDWKEVAGGILKELEEVS